MANDDPTKKDITSDAHDTLVKSLESIKDLLLQSESKISAARESIAKAGIPQSTDPESPKSAKNDATPAVSPTSSANMEPTFPAAPEVPLLDDVVIPGAPAEETISPSVEPKEPPKIDFAAMENELQEWRVQTEKRLHDTLVKRLVRVEAELKKQLEKDISALRKKLTKKYSTD